MQDERWGLEFSHTQAQCGDESPYQIVGQEGLPCCAYMLCACCGPIFTTQNSLVPIWAVFGAKWHRSPSFRVVWPFSGTTQPCVSGFLRHARPHKISTPSQPSCPQAFRFALKFAAASSKRGCCDISGVVSRAKKAIQNGLF